jgi:hypothetical protein
MNKGISFQGFVPVRKEPSEASEMITQVLFGETFRILGYEGVWLHISADFDSSEGWLRDYAIHRFEAMKEAEKTSQAGHRIVAAPSIKLLDPTDGQTRLLPAGSIYPLASGKTLSLHGREFELVSEAGLVRPDPDLDPEEIGKGLLSIPYLHGGRCGFGFDGAGLVQLVCRMMGTGLPRECHLQSEHGTTINFTHEIQPGDLAFFDNTAGEIYHAGIVLDGGLILHVYDRVRIDKLDQQGIFNMEKEAYTHRLRIIKRIGSQ